MEGAQQYDWPGNVPELQNVVERAVIVSHGSKIALDPPETVKPSGRHACAAQPLPNNSDRVIPEKDWRDRERANIIAALRQTNSRISGKGGAADLLAINASTLASRIRSLEIENQANRK
jgi:DNA-binding NtrC family response regulator